MRIRNLPFPLIIILLFCLMDVPSQAHWQLNKFDKKGERNGRWKYYYDDEKKKINRYGKYKHGEQSGKWKYYTAEGLIYKKEKYKLRKQCIKTTLYKDGKILKTGWARMIEEPDGIHYYWYGDWKYFDEKGKIEKVIKYDNGRVVNTILKKND